MSHNLNETNIKKKELASFCRPLENLMRDKKSYCGKGRQIGQITVNELDSSSMLDLSNKSQNAALSALKIEVEELTTRLRDSERERELWQRKFNKALDEKEQVQKRNNIALQEEITQLKVQVALLQSQLETYTYNNIKKEKHIDDNDVDVDNYDNYNEDENCNDDNLEDNIELLRPSVILLDKTPNNKVQQIEPFQFINLNDIQNDNNKKDKQVNQPLNETQEHTSENSDLNSIITDKHVEQFYNHSIDIDAEIESFTIKNSARKRKKIPDIKNWLANKRKINKNKGDSYLSTKFKIIPSKNKPSSKMCFDTCLLKCKTKFTNDQRDEINKNYWQLGSYSIQRDFINQHVKSIECKRTSKLNSRRKYTQQYFLPDNVQVCKKYFLSILNIGEKTVRNVKTKEIQNLDVGKDLRGKIQKKTSGEHINIVKQHIESFPTIMESYYARLDTSERLYITSSDLNLTKMFKLYLEFFDKNYNGQIPVKENIYRQIFTKEYNMSFKKPKSSKSKYENAIK